MTTLLVSCTSWLIKGLLQSSSEVLSLRKYFVFSWSYKAEPEPTVENIQDIEKAA